MSSRTSNLRAKIAFLLASLAALWAFAAFVTMREGLNLFWISTLDQEVGRPTDSLVAALQAERRISAVVLAAGDSAHRDELATARATTDAAAARFRESVRGTTAGWAATPIAEANIAELGRMLDGLSPVRADVDQRSGERAAPIAYYTQTIGVGYRIFATIASFDDQAINDQLSHLLIMSRGRELLSQEDALMSGVLAAGRFSATDAAEFAQLVGAQRNIRATGLEGLPDDKAVYQPVLEGPALTRLTQIEDLIVARARPNEAPPVSAADWRAAFDPALTALAQLDIDLAEATIARAKGPTILVIVRLILAAGLGLIAVIASIVLSITTARAIVTQLRLLRDAADELATTRLPNVVRRLRAGEEVDVVAEAPPLAFGNDEIGQVGQAFNAVQETAIRATVEQAELRRSVRDLFLSLARRSQTLVHRQLTMLDAMERRATDAAELDELFRVDHLATRMRRNAENLIVLAGAVPGRGWRRTIPVVDVIRAAVAEVEEYPRVNVLPSEAAGLAGHAVGDVVHLLAELMENALAFSPRHTLVNVGGSAVGAGYVIEVEDHGLGMTAADLEQANAQLHEPAEFLLTGTPRLGLYVVGRLAERHHIKVRLQPSAGGGTTAIVLLPSSLVSDAWTPVPGSDSGEHRVVTAPPQPAAALPVRAAVDGESRVGTAATPRPTSDLPVRVPRRVPAATAVSPGEAAAEPTRPEPEPAWTPGGETQAAEPPDAEPPVGAAAEPEHRPVTSPEDGPAAETAPSPAGPPAVPAPAVAAPPAAAVTAATAAPARVNGSTSDAALTGGSPVPAPRGPVEGTVYTPSGLPVRARPAVPAVPLADHRAEVVRIAEDPSDALPGVELRLTAGAPQPAPAIPEPGGMSGDVAPGPAERPASQVYSLIAAYQQGSRRGRIAAEELATEPRGPGEPEPEPEDRPALPRRPSPRTAPRHEEGQGEGE
ncbi:sensor histidine kinase [Catellatospora citrea]|uniref:histidine kinase n=1 Tax=Catellatospora citrea TaxID=53366 RepID=A0A8J3P1F5_9ACTN|nr:sensor histidine kinase [Catellatospora citrea]RKE11547.1 signal transduction histidine kinase [Catellatospora citrea]GIG00048.1 histidine kinase [Catellatospora citrea]